MFSLTREIAIIEQLTRHQLERVLPDGLLQPHFAVLLHLRGVGDGRSPLRIARAMQVVKGAMTNTLHRLEARGLVRVEPDPTDGRAKCVFITASGTELIEQAAQAVAPLFQKMSEALSEAEVATILPLLQRLRQHLDAARDSDA
jgi:DNA-binding MarR family transcriptional regulator